MVKLALVDKDVLLIDLGGEHLTLSTAGCPGTYSSIKHILFKSVPKNFDVVDLDKYCRDLANSVGLEYEKTTIFLTAVDVSTYGHSKHVHGAVEAEAYTTFGIDRPSCIDIVEKTRIGTINVAVIVNKPLDFVGLLDLFRLVSEVKGAVMALGGPTCASGISIGTASDAIAVVAPRGTNRFAGIATDVGLAAASAVIKALSKHLTSITSSDYIAKSLGYNDIENIINIAMRIYEKARVPRLSNEEARTEIKNELLSVVKDPNVVALIRGLRLLESALSLGLVPSVNLNEYLSDSVGIIVDELIGKTVAEYINGFKGLLAYYWIEKLKSRGELEDIRSLPPITDDIVAALVGGILSRIYDKYSRS